MGHYPVVALGDCTYAKQMPLVNLGLIKEDETPCTPLLVDTLEKDVCIESNRQYYILQGMDILGWILYTC